MFSFHSNPSEVKRRARHQRLCDCESTMRTVGRRANSGTGGCGEAVFLWLNHVYQQATSPEAAGSRRTRLDGLGKRSQDKIQTRAGGGSQSCERAPAALGTFQTHCDPDGSLLSRPAGVRFIIHATPAEAKQRFLNPSAPYLCRCLERSLRNLTWRRLNGAG